MDRAHRTQLVLGSVFTALGTLLVALGLAQLAFWWNGALSGLTIEPIVLPMGVVFLAVGVPKLLTARRLRWLERHGTVEMERVPDSDRGGGTMVLNVNVPGTRR